MEKRQFSIRVNAPSQKVWNVLWNDETYRKWTRVFSEGSYAVTDWKEGSKVQFLTPEGNGMYSTIVKNIPNQFMSIKHLGEIKNGVEQPADAKTEQWSGVLENYTLKEAGGTTELTVEMDMTKEFESFFAEVFPKALAIVKELAES
jgi:hypothetical protein